MRAEDCVLFISVLIGMALGLAHSRFIKVNSSNVKHGVGPRGTLCIVACGSRE